MLIGDTRISCLAELRKYCGDSDGNEDLMLIFTQEKGPYHVPVAWPLHFALFAHEAADFEAYLSNSILRVCEKR